MYTCSDCKYLDKTKWKKSIANNSINYGCSLQNYTVGWIKKDSELRQQGCSSWEEKENTE